MGSIWVLGFVLSFRERSVVHRSRLKAEGTRAMGKRKSRAKPPPKKRMDRLDTVFSCPFCNHGTSVECRLDMKNLIGEAVCGICQERFSTSITALTEPIDIYSEWIDECERVNTVEDDGA
ncbi:hypothetical protein NL676_008214 [Syzygium grande]|nr:hypothetical protein NL676_008214 [Syzygium grande]